MNYVFAEFEMTNDRDVAAVMTQVNSGELTKFFMQEYTHDFVYCMLKNAINSFLWRHDCIVLSVAENYRCRPRQLRGEQKPIGSSQACPV